MMTSKIDWFCNKNALLDLKTKSIRGGAITVVSQVTSAVLQIGSTILLARLLEPKDFGLIAMVASFMAFFSLFSNLGLSTATIQKETITHKEVSNLFWINCGLGLSLTLLGCLLAWPLAHFYSEPRLTAVTCFLSVHFLILSLGVQHSALLTRNMHNRSLAISRIISVLSGLTLAIIIAFIGGGYWALVCQQIISSVALLLAFLHFCKWRPTKYNNAINVKNSIIFGSYLLGFNILNFFVRNFDRILIGKIWGTASVGYYGAANRLLLMPITLISAPVAGVVIPGLSRLRGNDYKYKQYYLKALSVSCAAIFPIGVISFYYSQEIIVIFLGDKWMLSANIFQALGGVVICQPILNSLGWLYISGQGSKKMFKWALFASPVIVVAFIIGSSISPYATAAAFSVASLCLIVPGVIVATRGNAVNASDIFKEISKPAVAVIFSIIPLAYRYDAANSSDPEFTMPVMKWVLTLFLSMISYISILMIFKSYRLIIKDISSEILKRKIN